MVSLISISAPLLQRALSFIVVRIPFKSIECSTDYTMYYCTPSLNDNTYTTHGHSLKNTQIRENGLLPKIDLPSLSETTGFGDVEISSNENLKKISLPSLTKTGGSFFVQGNPNLRKLCASKLENVGSVCIGNQIDQPFLDADLSELETGVFFSFPACYQDSNASTVCGTDNGFGLFKCSTSGSSSSGCPSNAC